MNYQDLRGWLEEVEKLGELKRIEGAHWDREIGAITEIVAERSGPALLFDKITDYPEGFRVLSNVFQSYARTASVLGVPQDLSDVAMVDAWRKKLKEIKPVPPVEVKDGPIRQNILTGQDVDLFKFPTPIWHEHDEGRYLGTGCAVVSRDPDEGWVNLGTYRCRIFEKDLISVGMNPGKHGTMMMEKYHKRGESFPLAIICGMDPVLFLTAGSPLTGVSECEYDFTGGIHQKPVEVVRGNITDLPIPASAEIVLEGEIPPPSEMENWPDGLFGEWSRMYNSAPHPVMRVKSIMYRDDPIILGVVPWKAHISFPFAFPLMAAEIWNVLEYAGIPEVKGVWFGLGYVWPVFLVISIKQSYSGHAKQAALAAASCRADTFAGRYVIVVDDDIDITDEKDVLWAVASRADLDKVQIIHGIQTKATRPKKIVPGEPPSILNDRVIIDACWPYERRDKLPLTSRYSPQYVEKITRKWQSVLDLG